MWFRRARDAERGRPEADPRAELGEEAVLSPPLDGGQTAEAIPAGASWVRFATVGTALLVGQGSFYLTAAALPLYLRHLGVATAHIGSEVGVASFVGVLGTLAIGPFIDRWGSQRLLLAGMLCYTAAALGMLWLPSEGAVTACRGLQGLGLALVIPSALTMAPRLVPLRQGTALGVVGALNSVALAIYPAVGLALYAWGGAPALFLPAAACALVGATVVGAAVGRMVPPGAPSAAIPRGFGYDGRWTALLLANMLNVAYFGGIVAYLPLVLARVGGPNAGIFFSADALGVLLLRIPTGALVDRYGPRPAEVVGTLVTLAGIGALFLPPSVPALVAAGAGTGIGAGLFISAVLVALARRSGDHNRGTAMALSSASFNVGIFVGSAVSGLLIGPGGFGAVLLFGAVTTAASLPLVLLDREGRTPAQS
jgi:MFS family permease